MIRMNVDREQLETGVGLDKVVQKIIGIKSFGKTQLVKTLGLLTYNIKCTTVI